MIAHGRGKPGIRAIGNPPGAMTLHTYCRLLRVRLGHIKTLTLTAFLLIGALASGCSRMVLKGGDFSPPYSASVRGSSAAVELKAGEPVTDAFQQWLEANRTGWSNSFGSFAPGTVVRNDHFSLNFVDGGAVLNFQPDANNGKWIHWRQVGKACDLRELTFLDEINARIQEAKPSRFPGKMLE